MKIHEVEIALRHWDSLRETRQHELEWMLPLVKASRLFHGPGVGDEASMVDAAAERILALVGKPKESLRDWGMAVLLAKAALDIQDNECDCGDGQ